MKIAILEHEKISAGVLQQVTAAAGYECASFGDSTAMLDFLQRQSCNMLLLDGSAPEQNLLEIIRWSRQHLPPHLPILLLASNAAPDKVVNCLDQGATDYIFHPLRRSELAVRIRIALRRAWPDLAANRQIRIEDYVFEAGDLRVTFHGGQAELTHKEFELALLLFRNVNRPLSRAYIMEIVWSREMEVSSRTIDTHISRVRSKLQLRPERGYRLAPVYSFGYQLERLKV